MSHSRTLIYVTSVDLGALNGPSIHVSNVVNGLARRGWKVTLMVPVPSRGYVIALDPAVVVSHLPDTRAVRLPGGLAMFAAPFKLWAQRSADVIYVRSATGSVAAMVAARAFGRGTRVVEFNGWIADEAKALGAGGIATKTLSWWQNIEARSAHHVRAVTAPLRERAIQAGAHSSAVHVIPAGTNLDTFQPLDRAECRRKLGLDAEKPIAVFLGNLWPAIDIDVMMQGLARVRKTGLDLQLHVVGDGPKRAALESLIQAHADLAGAVRLHGSLPPGEANVVLGAANIALAPFVLARNDAIGLSPMKVRDYAAAGRVTVASAFKGITDFASEPWLFLAKPEDADDFTASMLKALAHDTAETSAAARQCAHKHFSWDAVVGAIEVMIATKI